MTRAIDNEIDLTHSRKLHHSAVLETPPAKPEEARLHRRDEVERAWISREGTDGWNRVLEKRGWCGGRHSGE